MCLAVSLSIWISLTKFKALSMHLIQLVDH
jgi:hypothetical protein